MKKMISILAVAAALSFAGCKKKTETGAASGSAPATGAKVDDKGSAAATGTEDRRPLNCASPCAAAGTHTPSMAQTMAASASPARVLIAWQESYARFPARVLTVAVRKGSLGAIHRAQEHGRTRAPG